MKQRRKWIGVWGLLFCLCMFPITMVQAEEYRDSRPNDYITKEFNVTVMFDKFHTAHITEEIKVDFRQVHHGITRNIPMAKDNSYGIKKISAEDYDCSVKEVGHNKVIAIGDKNKCLVGDKTFRIHYQIQYYKEEEKSTGCLVQNMLPTQWKTSIREANLTLIMPSAIHWDDMVIYAGAYGTRDSGVWNEHFAKTVEGNTLMLKGKNLPEGYGVTLQDFELEDGYWSKAQTFTEANNELILKITIAGGILALFAMFLWFGYGCDKEIVERVEFYPPDGITPAEVGYALDGELDDNELMSTILYLADKGYLTIESTKKKVVLHKIKNVDSEEPQFIKTFMCGLFPDQAKVFDTKSAPAERYKKFEQARIEVGACYEKKYGEVFILQSFVRRFACGLFAILDMLALCLILEGWSAYALPFVSSFFTSIGLLLAWKGFDNYHVNKSKETCFIVGGAVIYGIGVFLTALLVNTYPIKIHFIPYGISEAAIFFFSLIMQKRSTKNVELMGKLYGFRRFIKEAEYDRIVALCEEDPGYFYHILPYAMVLGLETAWTKHFENRLDVRNITTQKTAKQNPSWYHADDTEDLLANTWREKMVRTCTNSRESHSSSSSSKKFKSSSKEGSKGYSRGSKECNHSGGAR